MALSPSGLTAGLATHAGLCLACFCSCPVLGGKIETLGLGKEAPGSIAEGGERLAVGAVRALLRLIKVKFGGGGE